MELFKKILIIAAHPDDEILGCGGLIAKYHERIKFRVVFIAEGSSCRFASSSIAEIQEAIKNREHSARNALKKYNPESIIFENHECGKLDSVPVIKINKIIEKNIQEFNPDTVISHSHTDANSDHRRIAESIIMATRPGALNAVKTVMSMEIPSSTEWNFNSPFEPNLFISINDNEMNAKIEALEKYNTEIKPFPFPRSAEGLKAFARYRGLQSGNSYAEAFRIIRVCE